jgi:hypothetical protein
MYALPLFLMALASIFNETVQSTSRDQLRRLKPDGLPKEFVYNDDRPAIIVVDKSHSCAFGHSFFELTVNVEGKPEAPKRKSSSLRGKRDIEWVRGLLIQLRFVPFKVGTKLVAVHTYVTVACESP